MTIVVAAQAIGDAGEERVIQRAARDPRRLLEIVQRHVEGSVVPSESPVVHDR